MCMHNGELYRSVASNVDSAAGVLGYRNGPSTYKIYATAQYLHMSLGIKPLCLGPRSGGRPCY